MGFTFIIKFVTCMMACFLQIAIYVCCFLKLKHNEV